MQRYNRQKWRRGFKELNCVKKEKRKFVDFALQLELSTMSEISELILLLNKQHQEQMAVFRGEHQEQMAVLRDEHRERNRQHQEQNKQHQEQMAVLRGEHQEQITMLQEQLKILQSSLNNRRENVPTPMASFQPFDSTSELWTDYLARFRTFITANSIPDNKQAQIFLTNQSNSVYKMLSNLAAQQQPVKSIHELTMNDIQTFMAEQFDPKRFVLRERFKFWSDMKRKPGETIPELASRIRQDAATCDFQSIKDPLDEALRTKFICSVDNEAVLKTLFKLKDDELKFSNAIRVAQEVEEAAKVAKETVHGQPSTSVQKVYHAKSKTSKTQEKKTACFRCGNSGHFSKACPHCKKTGHLQSVCMSRLRDNSKLVKQQMKLVHKVQCSVSPIYQTIRLNDHRIKFEIDSGASDTFCCEATWQTLGKPTLQPVSVQYQVAEGSPLPVVGQFQSTASIDGKSPDVTFPVIVTKVPNLNLLGRLAMMKLKLTNLTDHLADTSFDGEEMEDDVDSVCLVRTISRQINPDNPLLVVRETAKDPILSQLMRFVKEGWPHAFSEELKDFKKLENSLSTENGCVFYGLRVIIPSTLRNHILKLLHLGHFGMQRMKQLARSTVYWPRIDFDIEDLCRKCTSCGQFQNKPDKPSIHPWMMPEKPWSRLHLDHAINFLGRNWLVLVDAYSKYPCIHPTTSTSSKSTTAILEQEFAHFGYPHTLVTDNATTFMSQEFQAWCKQRGIVHLTGAPYHPATNGAAERLIQSFKQALRKSSLPPKEALQEFLMQYRRIPFASGLSPSELLNGRRIRTKIDTLVPSIPHLLQGRQSKQASKRSNAEDSEVVSKVEHHYSLGDPCYALYFGPRRDRDPRWVPAIVTKVHGTRSVNVRVIPRGPTWRRHLDQLRPRYGSDQDDDPCEIPTSVLSTETLPAGTDHASSSSSMNQRNNPRLPTGDEYGRHNLRRSARTKRPPKKYCC